MSSNGVIPIWDESTLGLRIQDILTTKVKLSGIENVIVKIPEELKGEHFAAESIYIRVDFSNQPSKNLFLKIFANNPGHQLLMREMKIMETECSFYRDFLPDAQQFCAKRKGCENLLDIFPTCLYADDNLILMENLVLDSGFKMLPKSDMQDLEQAKVVLTNLGRLHAVSYAMILELGLDEFKRKWPVTAGDFVANTAFLDSIVCNGPRLCIDSLRDFASPGVEEAIEFLTEYCKKVQGRYKLILDSSLDSKLVTLAHGDCWNNNMLFKICPESGKILKHVFVDLQCTRLASPVIDINNFLYTSVKSDLRREFLLNLMKHYFAEFENNLKLLQVSCPISFEEFMKDFYCLCEFGFCMALIFLPTKVGALETIGFDTMGIGDSEVGAKGYNDAMSKWVDSNRDKMKLIGNEIILLVQEFKKLSELNV